MNFIYETNRIYACDEKGELIAEVTFPFVSDHVVNINHTFVHDSLRGQGVANKLLIEVANKLKLENIKAQATCSYAKQWFEKNVEYSDIYSN